MYRRVLPIWGAVFYCADDPHAARICSVRPGSISFGEAGSADYRFAVVEGGRPSITHYETLEAFPHASLLTIDLETGRTHQIRVHLSAMRHPCVGDTTYGADPVLAARLSLTRQWLHAVRLEFAHPVTGLPVVVESDYPHDLAHALSLLREGA